MSDDFHSINFSFVKNTYRLLYATNYIDDAFQIESIYTECHFDPNLECDYVFIIIYKQILSSQYRSKRLILFYERIRFWYLNDHKYNIWRILSIRNTLQISFYLVYLFMISTFCQWLLMFLWCCTTKQCQMIFILLTSHLSNTVLPFVRNQFYIWCISNRIDI